MEKKTCTKCTNDKPLHNFIKKDKILKMCLSCREIIEKSKAKHRLEHTCIHNRQKWMCKMCSGSCICEHNKRRNVCVECHGTSICEHNKKKWDCFVCKGSSVCCHNRLKYSCGACNGGKLYNVR